MKKRLSAAILALLMVSLAGAGCVRIRRVELPESPHPAPATEWDRTFGGPERDEAYSVQQTTDGGFVIAGRTHSFGKGWSDVWLIKTDPEGNKEWSRTFGGPEQRDRDWAYSVHQTVCGGFVIGGDITTRVVRVAVPAGVPPPTRYGRIWVVKTDAYGNLQWTATLGTETRAWGRATSVQQTACGGFIVAGTIDIDPFGKGNTDFWLLKLAPER